MARIRRKQGRRQSAPSTTTTAIAVRVPNALLEDVRRITGAAVQKDAHQVHYPDQDSAALKASVLAALSILVEIRTGKNRCFVAGLDEPGQDRERDLGLAVERLTEVEPPYTRRQAPARLVELEEPPLVELEEPPLVVSTWGRHPVGLLADVPQSSDQIPTDWLRFRLSVPHWSTFFPRRPLKWGT